MKVSALFVLLAVVVLVQAAPYKSQSKDRVNGSPAKRMYRKRGLINLDNLNAPICVPTKVVVKDNKILKNFFLHRSSYYRLPLISPTIPSSTPKTMKITLLVAAVAAASTVSAYQCPTTAEVNTACRAISVFPLICNNPNVNVSACNDRQCNQTYINNYSACQCRRSSTQFYENSVNVEGLLRRCGMAGLTNPYGNPYQYRPGQGTQTFSPSSSAGGVVTRVYNGTTYYGGQTAVISGTTRIVSATAIVGGTTILPGTTTWVSGTPGIIRGTSTRVGAGRGTRTAAPITSPTATAAPIVAQENKHISGGAVAGIVLGTLAAALLAGLLGWCWRKKRAEHTTVYNNAATTYDNRGPTRTVVTEKIEPVVVKSVPTGATTTTYNTTGAPVVASSSVPATYHTTTTAPAVVNTAGVHNPTSTTTYNPTSTTTYNPTSTTTYNTTTQPRVESAHVNGVHNSANAVNTGAPNTVHSVGNGFSNTATSVENGVHHAATAVNNDVHHAANTVSNTAHNATNSVNNAIH
ncbi:hypothetical protein BGZ83_003628 [Gryganskiella cystojenkinii]|nr:hypothetical protein BGZ83_003628 [Gryganskiella cystojenkinii]